MVIGRVSQLPRVASDMPRQAISSANDMNEIWKPYEDADLTSSHNAEQPLRQLQFVEQHSQLLEIASDMTTAFYAPTERFSSGHLRALHARYEAWYSALPEHFQMTNTTLPHALALHQLYHACILQ